MLRIFLLLFTLAFAGCKSDTKPSTGGIMSEKPKAESELAVTTLSKKAAEALELKTEPVTAQDVDDCLSLTGWIMAKPGHEVTLTAPIAGIVSFANQDKIPVAGHAVDVDQELLRLKPQLTPVEQIQIQSDLDKAQKSLEQAVIDRDLVKKLVQSKARNEQDLRHAQKAVDVAAIEVQAAKDKLSFSGSISVKAQQPGRILQWHVGPGQYVPISAPLVSVISLKPVWIRVPVPEYDLPLVVTQPQPDIKITWKNPNHERNGKPGFLSTLPANTRSPFLTAKFQGRVLQIDPVKRTADLWYELEPSKEAEHVVKDEMVNVRLPIGKKQKALVVPYSAVIFDAYGNSWIYVDRKTGKDPEEYERRWVELVTSVDFDVKRTNGDSNGLVIRSPGLADGSYVVTRGAAALFSREFFSTPFKVPGGSK